MRRILSLILLCASMAIAITTGEVRKVSTPAEFEGYEYGAVTVRYNGMFYRFYCSHGLNSVPFAKSTNNYTKGWDYVRMRTSRDGATWSSPRVVVVPSSKVDSCACDPAIIRGDDGYWYLYYTGFEVGYSTETFVARSRNIYGPYDERYVGGSEQWKSYPQKPEPLFKTRERVLKPGDDPDGTLAYGAGQVSVVKKGGKYHFWFTDVSYAPKGAVTPSAKLWKFVHVETDAPYGNFQNKPRTPISLDGETSFPMNDFGDVKWNPTGGINGNGQFEMWITSEHYSLAYQNEYNQYIMRYVSADGVNWRSTGDRKGPYHIISNVGMSGDSIGHIIGNRTLVTFAANKDSLNFKKDIDLVRLGCRGESCNESDMHKKWKYAVRASSANVDNLTLSDDVFEFEYPSLQIMWWNANHNNSVPGRPWSTYQFTVGSNINKGETILDSTNTGYANGMRYYQFPNDLKNRNLEFISGDYDGDGITDMGVVDRSTAKWYIRSSLSGSFGTDKIPWETQWPGLTSMGSDFKNVVGDFDGDGIADWAIVNKPAKKWFVFSSKTSNSKVLNPLLIQMKEKAKKDTVFGKPILNLNRFDHILTGDYDGDGISDIGAVDCSNPSFCRWSFFSSRDSVIVDWDWWGMNFNHVVLEGDYDGDGKTDRTIWDPGMGWFSISSRTGNALYDPYLILLDGAGRQIYDLVSPSGSSKQVVLDTIGDEKVKWYKSYGYQFKSISTVFAYHWTGSNFKPLSGDFNGDGTSDMTMVDVTDTDNSGYFTWFTIVTPPMSSSYFGHSLKYFKKIANPQFFVGDFDGDGISDCAMGDAANARVYFYTSSFKDKSIAKTISPLYNPSTGALYKAQFIPDEPIVPEEKIQSVPKTLAKFRTKGLDLMISDMNLGSEIGVYNTIGQRIFRGNAVSSDMKVQLPSKGMYVVRVGKQSSVINVK